MSIAAIAQFIGAHAVLLFIGGMLIMLAISGGLWRLLERYGESWWRCVVAAGRVLVHVADSCLPPRYKLSEWRAVDFIRKNYLGIHTLVGFGAAFTALLVFIEFADEIDEADALGRFDFALAAALSGSIQAQTYTFFGYATHLADKLTLGALLALVAAWLIARKQWLLLGGWLLAVIGNSVLNLSLKAFFQRTRPLHDHGFASADGWSFPSGHASGALVAFGMLAYLALRNSDRAWHLPIVLLAITVIQLVGGSRIILQVHYLTDVVAGFCSGAAWLAICIAGTEIALRHRRQ